MNKHPYLVMFLVVVLSAIVLCLLQYSVTRSDVQNDFNRNFAASTPLLSLDTLDIEFDSYYVAGQSQHLLYLGNLVAARNLLAVEVNRLDTQHIILRLDNPAQLKFRSIKVKVDSPNIYLVDGTVPAIFHSTLHNRNLRYLGKGAPYFLDLEPMQPQSFAIRSISDTREGILGKLMLYPFTTSFNSGLLKKQVDGIFCTEGMLHYDPLHERLIYIYAYRNEFLVMDTSLNLLSHGRTIDTVSTAKLNVASLSSTQSMTLASPPLLVNHHSALWRDYLLIHSELRADNEDENAFQDSSVIDVYRIENGKYEFSFYIPQYAGKPLRNFRIVSHRLMVLYEHHLIAYSIPAHLFQLSIQGNKYEELYM